MRMTLRWHFVRKLLRRYNKVHPIRKVLTLCLLSLLGTLCFGCASDGKFVPDPGMTEHQIAEAFYASKLTRAARKDYIEASFVAAKKLHEAEKALVKHYKENLIPYLREYKYEPELDLTVPIDILEEIRAYLNTWRWETEYPEVFHLLLKCYLDQYFVAEEQGERWYQWDTQGEIIDALEGFFIAYEQKKGDPKWEQVARDITRRVTEMTSREEAMPKVSKWWAENQKRQR